MNKILVKSTIAVAMVAAFGAANAMTTTATSLAYAKQLFRGTTPAVTNLSLPNLTVVSNVSIPANSTVYMYVKLNGASLSSLPTFTSDAALVATTVNGGLAATPAIATNASLGTTTGSADPAGVGAGVDYVFWKIQTNADVVGVGATLGVVSGLTGNNAASILTAPVTATASVGIGAPVTRFGALPAAASNYDATSTATTLGTSVEAFSTAAIAAGTTGKIDLTVTPASTQFTGAVATNTLQLGTVTFTLDATAKTAAGAAYTILVAPGDVLTSTITGPSGFFAPMGTTGQLWLQATTCGAAAANGTANAGLLTGSASTVFASTAAAAAATSVTVTSTANPVSGTVYAICMGIPSTIAAIEGTPTATAQLTRLVSTAVDSHTAIASTALWALKYNGQQVDIRSYVPAANILAGGAGYTSYTRVINTGSVSAPIYVATINETTGTVSSQKGDLGTLAAGASKTFTATEIEAALTTAGHAAIAAGDRPRLRFTAATNLLEVQSFMANPGGVVSDMTGAQ